MSELSCGVCVIGGGPAGSTTALRLARLGHDVCIVERARFPRDRIGESLPPSILPVLDTLGLRATIEAAGFLRPPAAIVRWAGSETRRDYGPGVAGFQVNRGQFDAMILDAARKAGALVLQPAQACRPRREKDGWHIDLRGHPSVAGIKAGFLIDAAGKHASLSRTTRAISTPTAALHAYWRTPRDFGPETRVEAGSDAWYWGAPLPDGRFNAAVFLDRKRCAGLTAHGREELYLDHIRRSALLSPCLKDMPLGPVSVCDAGCYADADPAQHNLLRVGEASHSIDPLSSQGVQSAMASAIQASIVVNTVLRAPQHAGLARRFYIDRQREAIDRHVALSSSHYARHASWQDTQFWRSRAGAPEALRPEPRDAPAPAVIEAGTLLRLSPEATLDPVPMVSGDMIESGLALGHPSLQRPVVYLHGCRVAPLLDKLRGRQTAEGLHRDWSRQLGEDRAADILKWLWRRRIILAEGSHRS